MNKVLDLFCGCGGFSKGFEMAGYTKGVGIDCEKSVQETFEYNHPDYEFILSNVEDLYPEDFKDYKILTASLYCNIPRNLLRDRMLIKLINEGKFDIKCHT